MLPHKFVEILDAEQKKKEMQYVDYLHMIKLTRLLLHMKIQNYY